MTFINNPGYLAPVKFIPSTLLITAISKAFPMQVTFTVPDSGSNTYIPGQLVKLQIPRPYGMSQASGLTGRILTVSLNSMTLNIDSSQFDTFAVPPAGSQSPASLVPMGSQNLEFSNTTNQVPFQPLNDRGN